MGRHTLRITIEQTELATFYADDDGKRVLREIHTQTQAELIASTPWTKHLAREIAGSTESLF